LKKEEALERASFFFSQLKPTNRIKEMRVINPQGEEVVRDDKTVISTPLPAEPAGFRIETRIPFLGEEWELCKMHGKTPPEGFSLKRALSIASSLHELNSADGPELQLRVIDPEGNEVVSDSNKNKKS
jgi:hypothetical protein